MTFYITPPSLLPKTDKRYKKWLKSLKKRPPVWNKGYTKENNSSIARISATMKRRGIDNFKGWRLQQIRSGKFLDAARRLERTKELAELVGVILGDGNIHKFPRTEALTIACNGDNKGFIDRYANLVYKVFLKRPSINKTLTNCVKIRIYQKYISKSLGIPTGARGKLATKIPTWILKNRENLISYLRGLYEAEGSFSVHLPTYTYKFQFSNRNEFLLNNVYKGLKVLGFHPHRSKYQIQISKKKEVYEARELLKFRQY